MESIIGCIKCIIGLMIIIEDFNEQQIDLALLVLYLVLSLCNGLTIGSLVYGCIYLLFWLRKQCGFGDVVLIISICMGKTMMQCALVNLLACIIGLLMAWFNHKKGKVSLPFAPSLLGANWLCLLIEQIIN